MSRTDIEHVATGYVAAVLMADSAGESILHDVRFVAAENGQLSNQLVIGVGSFDITITITEGSNDDTSRSDSVTQVAERTGGASSGDLRHAHGSESRGPDDTEGGNGRAPFSSGQDTPPTNGAGGPGDAGPR